MSADDVGNIMSGVTVALISRSMSLPSTPASRERVPGSRKRDVRECLVVRGDASLADSRALDDPLVRGVDVLPQVVVGQHALGHVHAEAGDADPRAVRRADHRSTANVRVPRAASWSPT